jgi:hypothetical protein
MTKLIKTLIEKVENTSTEVPIIPDYFLKTKLDTADKVPQKSRAGIYHNHVHVSSLAGDFCPRQYAIAKHENLSLFESLTGGHKVTFAIGRAVEAHIRENLIADIGKKNVYAKWTCECGKQYQQGFWANVQCSECGKPLDTFTEADVQDDENGVKGHPDFIFRFKNKLVVVEIKSMKKDQWDELEAPLESHIRQATMYPYLLSKSVNPDRIHPMVIYIYCTKDFKWGSPYKEFHVDASEERYEKQRQDALAEAKQIKDYVQGGETPPRICQSQASSLAKKCPVAFRCFNVYKDEIR